MKLYFSSTDSCLFRPITLGLVLLFILLLKVEESQDQMLILGEAYLVLNPVSQWTNRCSLQKCFSKKFSPCILVSFTISLLSNLHGMIPYNFIYYKSLTQYFESLIFYSYCPTTYLFLESGLNLTQASQQIEGGNQIGKMTLAWSFEKGRWQWIFWLSWGIK